MKTIQVSKATENIVIPFDDGTSLTLVANFGDDNLMAALKIIADNQTRARELMNAEEAEARAATSEMLHELIALILGENGFSELSAALGASEGVSVDFGLTIVYTELCEMVSDRVSKFANAKAGHYLADFLKAQGNAGAN